MSINENWNIRSRSHTCAQSGAAFTDGELFYTALFEDPETDELVRRDYSQESWKSVRSELKPFSFWKSTYEAPKSDARPEVVEKESAEGLLRRLIEEDERGTENTRYILAVMLERKKILKHTATRETDEASFLVYEHPKSGEVYIIRDPDLRLDQVEFVQREVSLLLSLGQHSKPKDPPAEAAAEATSEASPAAADGTVAEPEAVAEGGESGQEDAADTVEAAEPAETEAPLEAENADAVTGEESADGESSAEGGESADEPVDSADAAESEALTEADCPVEEEAGAADENSETGKDEEPAGADAPAETEEPAGDPVEADTLAASETADLITGENEEAPEAADDEPVSGNAEDSSAQESEGLSSAPQDEIATESAPAG